MITVLEAPQAVCPSKNPIVYKLQSDNYIVQIGSAATITVEIPGGGTTPFSEAETITFVINGVEITLTAMPIPNNEGYEFRIFTGENINLYATRLAEDWRKNYILSSTFNIGVYNNVITLSAWEIKDMTVSVSSDAFYQPTFSTNNGVSVITQPDFKILIEVFCRIQSEDKRISIQELEVDNEGICSFDISEVVDAYLDCKPIVLDNDSLNTIGYLYIYDNDLKFFYIRYAEKYGTPSVVQSIVKSDEFIGILSAESKNKRISANFYNNFLLAGKFMTELPDKRVTNLKKSEILSFFINNSQEVYSIEYFLYDKNTVQLTTGNVLLPFNGENGYYILPIILDNYVNRASLLNSYPTGKKLTVRLKFYNLETYASNEITYLFEDEKLYNTYFLFQGNYGLETIWCTGEREESVKIEKLSVNTFDRYDTSIYRHTPLDLSVPSDLKISYRFNSGIIKKSELPVYMSLVSSEYTWIGYFINGVKKYKRINIDKGNYRVYAESDDTISISFSGTLSAMEVVQNSLFL